jgi:hypothetical protein
MSRRHTYALLAVGCVCTVIVIGIAMSTPHQRHEPESLTQPPCRSLGGGCLYALPPSGDIGRPPPADFNYEENGAWLNAVVVPGHKLVFCPIPKVASTAYLRLLRRLSGFTDWDRNPYFTDPDTGTVGGLRTIGSYPPHLRQAMMTGSDWTKVAVVREPAHRLLSAWTDKVRGMHDGPAQLTVYADALGVPEDQLWNTSLEDFVTKIESGNHWNQHWAPQSTFCDLRVWRSTYQHVFRLEGSEVDCLMRAAETNSPGIFPLKQLAGEVARPYTTITSQHYTHDLGIHPSLIRRIHAIYAEDYARFGYTTI